MKKIRSDPDQVLGIDELVVNIFTRLSVTSLGRCRCVCKSWYRVLTDAAFINDIHLNSTIINRPRQLWASKEEDKYHYNTIYTFVDAYKEYVPYEGSRFKFELKEEEYKRMKIYTFLVGSCNGLVCLSISFNKLHTGRKTIVLWNPVTTDYKIAPISYILDDLVEDFIYNISVISQAFAYDHHNNDYKVLRFVHSFMFERQLHVDVYSLKSNSWISLNDIAPPGLWIHTIRYTVYNGCIYMVVSDMDPTDLSCIPSYPPISKIIKFCLKDNSFHCDLPMPPDLPSHADTKNYFDLKNIEGQLTAFQFYHSPSDQSKLKLWTLDEDTHEWITWMTISTVGYELGSTRICDYMEPICMNPDGQLLLALSCTRKDKVTMTKLGVFDTKTSSRSVLGDFFPLSSRYGAQYYLGQMTYTESLVSPNLFEPYGDQDMTKEERPRRLRRSSRTSKQPERFKPGATRCLGKFERTWRRRI